MYTEGANEEATPVAATTDQGNGLNRKRIDEVWAARKNRDKAYIKTSRIIFYTALFAFESVVVGICNISSSHNDPWNMGLNLSGGIMALLACLYPFFSIRANTKSPPGPKMKTFLRLMTKVQVPLCAFVTLALFAFAIVTLVTGVVECNARDEYDLHLYLNRCHPGPKNLYQLSILDTVLFAILTLLMVLMTLNSSRNKQHLILQTPN